MLTNWSQSWSRLEESSTTQKSTDFTKNTSDFGLSTTEESSTYTKWTTTTEENSIPTKLTKSSHSTFTPTIDKRKEVREKRKQMKQEMEEVIKVEKLEGSFGDKDTDWTTSEDRKIPLSVVTERSVLLSLLKDKIMSFVDNVLKRSTKSNVITTRSNIEKRTTNTTVKPL
uniref:Uncharacterized protein n=1 Tax=Graphocephala atropunctata TaxID=36148 RepID=A0A1B6KJ58_9HEMI